jgi:methyltransferase (TIGR00027 family)
MNSSSGTIVMALRFQGGAWQVGGGGERPGLQESFTAMGTALMRAAHTRLDPEPLIADPWGDRLVPESVRATIRDGAVARAMAEGRTGQTPDALLDAALVSGSAFTNVILRTRYCEDALGSAVARGTRQYLIIGAGFDSFALRPPASAQDVAVFEIDRPATQALKRRRIAECGLAEPTSLHFVAADLAKDSLDRCLAGSAYRPDLPALFSWLGVTMFLTREACLATLQVIARCSAKGSQLVFTYFDEQIYRTPTDRFRNMQAYVNSVGEPFRSGFDPRTLEEDLAAVGLGLIEDLTETQLLERYQCTGHKSMIPLEHSHIALARVQR